jgi:hypothetical protein
MKGPKGPLLFYDVLLRNVLNKDGAAAQPNAPLRLAATAEPVQAWKGCRAVQG